MKVSDFITKLQELKVTYGNLEVAIVNDEETGYAEWYGCATLNENPVRVVVTELGKVLAIDFGATASHIELTKP